MSTTPKETPLQSPTMELSTEGSFSESECGDRSHTTSVKTELTVDVSNSEKQGHYVVSETTVEQKSDDFASSSGVSDLAECDMTGKCSIFE